MSSSNYRTPDYSHVYNYNDVYEPCEDTFLMLDALEKDCDFLKKLRPRICIEVGSGSGIVITFLSSMLGSCAHYIATDLNPSAALCTEETAQRNGASVSVVCTNLVDALRLSRSCEVDVLIFNPPYVVTPSDEVSQHGISAAWAGGECGREVMDKLFPVVPRILSDEGVFYLLAVEENKPDEISKVMSSFRMKTETILSRKAKNERLHVLKIQRDSEKLLK